MSAVAGVTVTVILQVSSPIFSMNFCTHSSHHWLTYRRHSRWTQTHQSLCLFTWWLTKATSVINFQITDPPQDATHQVQWSSEAIEDLQASWTVLNGMSSGPRLTVWMSSYTLWHHTSASARTPAAHQSPWWPSNRQNLKRMDVLAWPLPCYLGNCMILGNTDYKISNMQSIKQ